MRNLLFPPETPHHLAVLRQYERVGIEFDHLQRIGNGVNAETTDTLQVVKLDADSLVLAQNGQVVWRFGRKK